MTPELLAARREILLARIALQRARLVRETASLREAANHAIPSALCSQAIAALRHAAAAAPAASLQGERSWIDWVVLALQIARTVASLRQPG